MPIVANPESRYLGTPCRRCGERLRYKANGDCAACKKTRSVGYARAYRKREHVKDYYKNYYFKKTIETRYGLSREQFEKLCATQKRGKLVVDHCHATGQLRGLICHKCNSALGMAKDDPKILENAAAYLRKYANA